MLIFIFTIMFAQSIAQNDTNFRYVELHDITIAYNNYENLRNTIEICYAINDTQTQRDDCSNYALLRATTIHA